MSFSIGDKVKHKLGVVHGEVIRLGPVIDFPGKGPARKVWWRLPTDAEEGNWNWDFELEAW